MTKKITKKRITFLKNKELFSTRKTKKRFQLAKKKKLINKLGGRFKW